MRLFYKKVKKEENTIPIISKYLSKFDEKHYSSLLNGNYKTLSNWSILQEILFYDTKMEETLSFFIVKCGIDLNLRTRKGISCFHLYLLLLFYHKNYKDKVDNFITFLNYGLLPNHLMVFNHKKIYSMLDVLYLLQFKKKPIIPKTFFPSNIELDFSPLSEENYNRIYLLLVCNNEKFFRITKPTNIPSMHHFTINNVKLCENKFVKDYLVNQYNLPYSMDTEKIQETILYLVSNFSFYKEYIEKQKLPIGTKQGDSNYIYVNPDFVPNGELQNDTFMHPIENKFKFHQTFLSNLIKTKMNPYTRQKIDEETISTMIEEFIHKRQIFPISTIKEKVEHFPFIFTTTENDDPKKDIKNLVSYVESFFAIGHPYNQMYSLQNFKSYQIKYLSHILTSETSLFPKFKQCLETPTVLTLFQVLLEYCRNKNKFIQVIYFFVEEIFQDLRAYERIKDKLNEYEKNYDLIVDIYLSRFNITNNHYLSKFMKNIYTIRDFDV